MSISETFLSLTMGIALSPNPPRNVRVSVDLIQIIDLVNGEERRRMREREEEEEEEEGR